MEVHAHEHQVAPQPVQDPADLRPVRGHACELAVGAVEDIGDNPEEHPPGVRRDVPVIQQVASRDPDEDADDGDDVRGDAEGNVV